jgi:transposase-like protein
MRANTKEISSALNLYYDGSSVRAIGRHFQQETGHTPSTASIYEWVQRYSQYLTDSTKDYHPNVGREWVADETVLKMGGSQVWLWDIIDTKTRVLLASRLSRSRTTRDAQILIDKAIKTAGKEPETVLTDQLASYLDVFYGKDTEHKQGSPFSKTEGESTSKIERWHGTLKARTKVMRGLKNFESALDFTDSYLAYYNYLRPHESLDNKTPAEVAGISYPYRNWDDVIRNYKPKAKIEITHVERESFKMPKVHIGRPPKMRLSSKPRRLPMTSGIYTDKSGSMFSRRPRGRGWRRVY